ALFIATDMSNAVQIEAMVARVADEIGGLDILINNVGGGRPQPFLEQSKRSIQRHLDLNLMSMLTTTHAATPLIVAGGRGGTLINVASTEALRAAPGFAVYAACKAAMVSFTKSMALELAAHGIRSHALAPDMI